MSRLVKLLVAACFALLLGAEAASAEASTPPRSPNALIDAVERRASATDFRALDRFGEEAMTRRDREGLNRLYHVAWLYLNQGEFDHARLWNGRLETAARRQNDGRYVMIAHLNDLSLRYDSGEKAAADQMRQLAATQTDWFTRVHATRLYALSLMDEDRIGDALKMLADIDGIIPEKDPYAATAHAGVWEVAGIGLMKLNDFEGSATAFGKFEIDFANPAYPRPDFDSLYNLARLAVQVGDQPLADRLAAAHHRLAARTGLQSLLVYDASLCAAVAQARHAPHDVLRCLAPYGHELGAAAFLAGRLLPMRAIANAQLGNVAAARADLAEIRRREAAGAFREDGASEIPHVEAELLFAEGRPAEAYRKLRDYDHVAEIQANRRFSAGIRQVTGDMQDKLDRRRQQLETERANTDLQKDVIQSQNWIVGIAVVFFLSAIATVIWQFRLSKHLRVARRRAEAANLSKSEFLANMSHEIRTPLNGIVAMADTLARAEMKPREKEMVEVIRSSGVTLERLLSDILDSARIESGNVTIETAPFHLGDTARGVGMLWAQRAEEKAVTLEVAIDPALDQVVSGDPVRFRQILTNLISNALKFTDEGMVRMAGEMTESGLARFTVSDTGVGFDDAEKGRIFGRFQQADGSITRRFGGTGLGLAISRDLSELMGGTLDCSSRPGEGATFWFELPLPECEAAAPIEVASVSTGEGFQDEEGRPLRILLADDHPANRKVVEIMLAESAVELIPVENGQEAVEAYSASLDGEAFDLILMDMQMPVMDGLTATAAIRALEADKAASRIPIIMLTANALAEHVAAGQAAGADGHLAKPITLASLFGAIETTLAGAAEAEAAREAA
jgi:signal transduction histidine kinase/AmiR/NasT family two-component response regulator